METPLSTKKALREHTTQPNTASGTFPASRRIEDPVKSAPKSRRKSGREQKGRSALVNITNDSPIIGLAMGSWGTPSCTITKQRSSRVNNGEAPGSGEALLRSQVRSLLQKAEEETRGAGRHILLRAHGFADSFSSSSLLLAAPTPTNTPIIPDLTTAHGLAVCEGDSCSFPSTPLPVVQEELDGLQDDNGSMFEAQKSLSRSLLLDFSERSEFSAGLNKPTPVTDDDDDGCVSVWSTQVHASSGHGDELAEFQGEDDREDHDHGDLGGLCDAMVSINLNGKGVMKRFSGVHIRYVYDSDDEIKEVHLCDDCKEQGEEDGNSFDALCLRGLPSPKGKHIRFASTQGDD